MKILVVSKEHGLVPLVHILKRAGHDVELVVWKRRFEKAWDGRVRKVLRSSKGEINKHTLDPVVKAAEGGDVVVLTDFNHKAFADSLHKFGVLEDGGLPPMTSARLGGWFDGERFTKTYWLVYDLGLWPGGFSSLLPAGLTLINSPVPVNESIYQLADELKSSSFKGLVEVGLVENKEGELVAEGKTAGWPFLHTQAFLAELDNFGEVLTGKEPLLRKRFVTVVPVSIPPWPFSSSHLPSFQCSEARPGAVVEGLTPQQQGRVFWFDIQVDEEERQLHTAGLDGLVGVVTGSADTLQLSSVRALELATLLQLPEKQFRPDAGALVPRFLSELESNYEISL